MSCNVICITKAWQINKCKNMFIIHSCISVRSHTALEQAGTPNHAAASRVSIYSHSYERLSRAPWLTVRFLLSDPA
jgi:hypothetical protein